MTIIQVWNMYNKTKKELIMDQFTLDIKPSEIFSFLAKNIRVDLATESLIQKINIKNIPEYYFYEVNDHIETSNHNGLRSYIINQIYKNFCITL